jgi:hypothetical protein
MKVETIIRSLFVFLLISSIVAAGVSAQNDPDRKEWIQLFNGKDLAGWQVKITGHELNDNYGNTFRVKDGSLAAVYDQYETFDGKFGHIFYQEKFSHYVIRVEYRFTGEQVPGAPGWALRNSGVMFHSQPPESMRKDQDFPICVEVQLLGGTGSGERSTANLCTPGTNVVIDGKLETRHCINSSSKTYDGDQWVTTEVEVLGDGRITHFVEGEKVLIYEKPQIGGGNVSQYDETLIEEGRLLSEGYISLQSESHPVEFRKVELLNLVGCTDPKASNYKTYFVKSDNSQCQ